MLELSVFYGLSIVAYFIVFFRFYLKEDSIMKEWREMDRIEKERSYYAARIGSPFSVLVALWSLVFVYLVIDEIFGWWGLV